MANLVRRDKTADEACFWCAFLEAVIGRVRERRSRRSRRRGIRSHVQVEGEGRARWPISASSRKCRLSAGKVQVATGAEPLSRKEKCRSAGRRENDGRGEWKQLPMLAYTPLPPFSKKPALLHFPCAERDRVTHDLHFDPHFFGQAGASGANGAPLGDKRGRENA